MYNDLNQNNRSVKKNEMRYVNGYLDNVDIIVDNEPQLNEEELKLLRSKLKNIRRNQMERDNIFTVLRGEGRKEVIDYVLNSDCLFNWGLKCEDAYRQYTYNRRSTSISYEKKIEIIINKLQYKIYGCRRCNKDTHYNIEGIIEEILNSETVNEEDFLDYMYQFLNCGNIVRKIVLSNQRGRYAFENAVRYINSNYSYNIYRRGIISFDELLSKNEGIIIESYINNEEIDIYSLGKKLSELLRKRLGIELKYKIQDYEVITKYAIFPQNIIGYFHIRNGEIKYYINPNIVKSIRANPDYNIGDYFNIDQNLDDYMANSGMDKYYVRDINGRITVKSIF